MVVPGFNADGCCSSAEIETVENIMGDERSNDKTQSEDEGDTDGSEYIP
jgi:hypothetical protein